MVTYQLSRPAGRPSGRLGLQHPGEAHEASAREVAAQDPVEGLLRMLLLHLERIEQRAQCPDLVLASTVQACVHLLTLGGYGLPLQS